jgi:hypothetical protein
MRLRDPQAADGAWTCWMAHRSPYDDIRITMSNIKIYNQLLVSLTARPAPKPHPKLRAALATINRPIDAYATRLHPPGRLKI